MKNAAQRPDAYTAAISAYLPAVALGAALGVATLAISPFLPAWLGAEPEIRRDAAVYFAIVCAPMLFRASSIIFGSVLRAASDMKTPMLVGLLTNGINVVLNFFLIYESRTMSLGPVNIPVWGAGLGVAGAAIATAIAHIAGGSLMLVGVLRNPLVSFKGRKLKLDKPVMGQCVRVGFPVALERMGACLGQVVFTSLVTSLGTVALAANQIAVTAEGLCYLPAYGISYAGIALVGQAVGARKKEDARAYGTLAAKLGFVVAIGTASALFLLAPPLAGLFNSDPRVVEQAALMLRIVAFCEPFFALSIILSGTLRGAHDVRLPMVVGLVCMWGIRVPLAPVLVYFAGFGLAGVWLAMDVDLIVRGLLCALRWRSGKWARMCGLE